MNYFCELNTKGQFGNILCRGKEKKKKKEEDVLFILSFFAEIWLESWLLIRL